MSGNERPSSRKNIILWIALLCFAVINLMAFLYALFILRPVWNEIGIFISNLSGIGLDWAGLYVWATAFIAIFFAGGSAFLLRRLRKGERANLPLPVKILLFVVLVKWNTLLAVLYMRTGELFLVPELRYLWDIAGPWILLILSLPCGVLFAYTLARAKTLSERAGKGAFRAAGVTLGLAAVLLAGQTARSFSLRCGPPSSCVKERKDTVDYVNPLIGTRGGFEYGKALPLVAAPFGMTHWTPMTQEGRIGVHPYKYHHNDAISGFLGTHKPAIWMGDYGQVALMPGIGEVRVSPKERGLRFAHKEECSTPYYYSVRMKARGGKDLLAEMTATERCGYLRFHFPGGERPHVVIEASREVSYLDVAGGGPHKGDHVFPGWVKIDMEKGEITGYNTDRDSCDLGPPLPNFKGYFVIQFSAPVRKAGTWENKTVYPDRKEQSGDLMGAYAVFDTPGNGTIEAKIGTSFISLEQARDNLAREIPRWDFGRIKTDVRTLWQRKLDVLSVEGASEEEKEVFYTAMYRCLLFPRVFSEYGRYYSAFDDKIHNGISYNDYSLWDTFRALHPLLLFIAPERVPGMITSLLQMYREGGWMPKWPNPTYTNIMIGTHADSVIADAYVKGERGFDAGLAYRAMLKDATTPPDGEEMKQWGDREPWTAYEARAGLTWYKKLGFIPSEKVAESVSCTLEYAYDDFCVAMMARAMGKKDDYQTFMKRSKYYKNLYNPATGFMAPRRPDGSWDPHTMKGFTEGDPWTYLFCAMQDVPGMIALIGGPEKFLKKLDENFDGGHYVHENEPGHHYIYLYDYAGAPWKAQEKAREYCLLKYRSGPAGLTGDEDCGQMSAWFLFSAMGFYPVAPGSDEYAIGSPLFPKVTIRPDPDRPDRKFEIIAKNVSRAHKYIQSATLNGKPLNRPFLRHGDIVRGSSLVFIMGDKPNYSWK